MAKINFFDLTSFSGSVFLPESNGVFKNAQECNNDEKTHFQKAGTKWHKMAQNGTNLLFRFNIVDWKSVA